MIAREEVKTIKDCKSVRISTFAYILTIVLLLSSLMGITVWAGKPGKKPFEPPPPIQYYMFSIFIEGYELNLVAPECLTVESYADDSGWYLTPEKNLKAVDWIAGLNELGPWWPGPGPQECGKYTTQNLEQLPTEIDAQSFEILYYWTLTPHKGLGYNGQPVNFWEFWITWGMNPNDPRDHTTTQSLHVWTDYDDVAEGSYHPIEDKWIIDFKGASWELYAFDADGYGYVEHSGTLADALSVTIINNGPVAS